MFTYDALCSFGFPVERINRSSCLAAGFRAHQYLTIVSIPIVFLGSPVLWLGFYIAKLASQNQRKELQGTLQVGGHLCLAFPGLRITTHIMGFGGSAYRYMYVCMYVYIYIRSCLTFFVLYAGVYVSVYK